MQYHRCIAVTAWFLFERVADTTLAESYIARKMCKMASNIEAILKPENGYKILN